MEYAYEGSAHRRLFDSYGRDEAPFPTDETMVFPARDYRRAENELLHEIFFPRYFNAQRLLSDPQAVADHLQELGTVFTTGIRPYGPDTPTETVAAVIDALPEIRRVLKTDVTAAYKGDPAAKSYLEIVRSYPSVQALCTHRVAHALYEQGGGEYARELTEHAKRETGIDIHPGATVGECCFIDHGTGVVVGETATIGDWVRIYQDVTLGALHFETEDDDGRTLKKGYKRHPDIGDDVVIGAGTKVLGAITIGDRVSIGANSWVTEDVPDDTHVYVSNHPDQQRKSRDGSGGS